MISASRTHFPPGTLLAGGRYRIERVLGEGGMGAVYAATELTLERLVALKVLLPELSSHPTARQRMEAEAKALARMNSPHVVRVHTVFDEAGLLVIDLEYLEGGAVVDRLDGSGVDEATAQSWIEQVLSGLEALHDAGLVHRDLKPANVLFDQRGTLKVTDLGIAQDAQRSGGLKTRHDANLGTPEYMAPEQVQSAATVDARADLYAAGVMLYELLTGRVPFVGDDWEVKAAHVKQAPDLEPVAAKSPRLVKVVERALAKDPAQRWQSARAFREALSPAAEPVAPASSSAAAPEPPAPLAPAPSAPVQSVPAPSAPATPAQPSRSKVLLALGAVAGLAGFVALGWWMFTRPEQTPALPVAAVESTPAAATAPMPDAAPAEPAGPATCAIGGNGKPDNVVCGSGPCTCNPNGNGVAVCPADCAVCPDNGDLAIPIDDAGVKKVVCAHDYPAWWKDGSLSPNELVDQGDGTVFDRLTGLYWQKNGSAAPMADWATQKAYCDALVLAGKTDWRMPTLTELRSLVDFSKTECPTASEVLTGFDCEARSYWSVTPSQGGLPGAWGGDFYNGGSYNYDVGHDFRVLCVR